MGRRSGGGQNALGARGKARTRKARKTRAKAGRGKVRGAVLGFEAANQNSDDDPATKPLEYQPRYSPKAVFNAMNFTGYIIFLVLFLAVTALRRNSDVYNFSEMAKSIVMTEHFLAIGADTDYFEWLSLHFLPGLAGMSYMAAPDSNFRMVGAPRIRQVRAAPCEPDAELDFDGDGWTDATKDDGAAGDTYHPRKVVPACWRDDEETGSTESFGGPGRSLFTYQDPAELGERPHYNSEGGLWLPGGGFVIPADMLKRLMVGATGRPEEAATVEVPVTEFYGFSYTGYNVSELQDNGWWDARTTAIFHDFTIAASNGMYSHCRLILTVGNNHGLIHSSVEMHMMWLESFPDKNVVLDIVFFIYVIVLIIGELAEFYDLYKSPNELVQENITEQRYWLYQRFLQFAAFHGIAKYDPHPYMERLMHRLHVKYQDEPPTGTRPPTREHIERMNKIGLAMVKCHDDWRGMVEVGTRRVDFKLSDVDEDGQVILDDNGQRQAALATLSLFDRVQKLHDSRLKIKEMQRLDKLGLCSPQQFRLRFPIAFRLFFSQSWNLVDGINYGLFMWAMMIRIKSLNMIPQIKTQIDDLNVDTMDMKYINFSELAHSDRLQYNINAFNAILTWIKIFKYLDFYPPMLTLTNTLYRASKMLGSLIVTISIVLLGSGQGFFMAFGLEVHMYRDFSSSVMSLLRMAVGDFDYTELAESNRTLGPLMFWLYILLVFFVLMSMFIALVSEAFEEAKDAQQNRSYSVGAYRYRRLRTKKLLEEAADRWRYCGPENTGILSKALHRQLSEFSDRPPEDPSKTDTALMLFLQHQKDSDKTAEGADVAVPTETTAGQKMRRGSVSQIDFTRSSPLSANPTELAKTAEHGFESSWVGKKFRSRMYWSTGCDIIKTKDGQKREVPGWFKKVEARRKGVEYIATKHYDARDPFKELSFAKGAVIVVTDQPPGGHKDPITGQRKEGVWKGYLKKKGPASVKIVYGFNKQDKEGRYSRGGFLQEVERNVDRLADAVDLSDSEDDVDPDLSDDDLTEDDVEHVVGDHINDGRGVEHGGNDGDSGIGQAGNDGGGSAARSKPSPLAVQTSSPKTLSRDLARPLSMAQPDPAYYATGDSSSGRSFGETRQHEQSRKQQELEKRVVEQDKELKKLRKENETLKVQSMSRRESQLAHANGTGSSGLEARVDAIAEALHGTIPAAIAASTEQLRSELDELKSLLLDGAGSRKLSGGGDGAGRSVSLSTDRPLANREDGKWVKMANVEGSTLYGDAEEYWHHTGTNAIRKSPPPGVQAYDNTGEPIEIDGAAMRWDDESNDSILSDLCPPGQVFDPVAQSRLREKHRKMAQARERLRKAGEPGIAYGMRNTPASMALESGGISRPTQLANLGNRIAGGTMK